MPSSKPSITDQRSVDAALAAFPGNPPSSPNSPANMAAAEAAALAETNRVQAERHALEQAVRSGANDLGQQ